MEQQMEWQTAAEEKRPNHRVIKVMIFMLGLLIGIGYPIFNILAYNDYSRQDPSIYETARWRSMIFGILLFAARAALFCKDAAGGKDRRLYQVGTWILQGIYMVLCILSLLLLLRLTKGQYSRETIHYFNDFKEFLVFLAISQGMLQRIFHNGYELLHAWNKKLSVNFWPYLFRIIGYAFILFWACKGVWNYTFVPWIRELLNIEALGKA